MKKKLIILGSVVLMAASAVFAFGTMESDSATGLELRNIEALSAGETSTSWRCDGPDGMCRAKCGSCKTSVGGLFAKGSLSGSHKCN